MAVLRKCILFLILWKMMGYHPPPPNNLSKRLWVWLNHMTPSYSIDVARSKGRTTQQHEFIVESQYCVSYSIIYQLLSVYYDPPHGIFFFPISSSCINNNQQNVRFTLYQRISRYFLTAVIKTLIVSLCKKKPPVETLVVLFRAVTAGCCVVVLNSIFNSTLLCFFPRFFFF